uniref:Uncharacterized protein n=1 Tax=Bactrocera dorsalis TaxID=27457 RepID=A0A034W0N0_BACDO
MANKCEVLSLQREHRGRGSNAALYYLLEGCEEPILENSCYMYTHYFSAESPKVSHTHAHTVMLKDARAAAVAPKDIKAKQTSARASGERCLCACVASAFSGATNNANFCCVCADCD